ncbi:LOW QUALITY PROTEIN: uncharacterized protein LOC112564827 [Pomacea canaliculata]|uniref:LOW QUALITY PROTEIN: uncharacterized protein LOC112564827 n=1 Tax=Pomacea canaliculata TaxID=400727 RepID=UPI000D727587|nr:LOW QUALITY PROTEIN: uncharacterized protein LOC112564827 [Pomacea canaliculata]
MPPRYQLTLRDIQGEEEVGSQANTSPESRSRSQTPRSARPRSPAAKSLTTANTRSKQHVTLTSCGGSDEGFRKSEAGSNTVLPARTLLRDLRASSLRCEKRVAVLRGCRRSSLLRPTTQRPAPGGCHGRPPSGSFVRGARKSSTVQKDKGRHEPVLLRCHHALLSSRDDESYIAHLRKLYLNGVRDLAKARDREPDIDRHKTIKERIDYDRKVGRILQYYADVDLPVVCKSGIIPSFQPIFSRLPVFSFTGDNSRFLQLGHLYTATPVVLTSRIMSLLAALVRSAVKKLFPRPQILSGMQAMVNTRINNKATLHKRQFYLHTPARDRHVNAEDGRPDSSSCLCAICRLEMHVALLTRVQAAHCPVETFSIQSPKTSDNPSSGVSQDDSMTKDTRNGQVSVTMKTRACAAVRPQSVASYLHSDPVVLFEDRRSLLRMEGWMLVQRPQLRSRPV